MGLRSLASQEPEPMNPFIAWPNQSPPHRHNRSAIIPAGLVIGSVVGRQSAAEQDSLPTQWVLHRNEHALVVGGQPLDLQQTVWEPTIESLGRARESLIVHQPNDRSIEDIAHWLHEQGYRVIRADFATLGAGYVWHSDDPTPTTLPFRWNPLDVACDAVGKGISNQITEVQEVIDLARTLLGNQTQADATSLLIALVHAIVQSAPTDARNLTTIHTQLRQPTEDLRAWLECAQISPWAPTMPEGNTLAVAQEWLLHQLSTILTPPVAELLSGHTFRVDQLMDLPEPFAVLCVTPPDTSPIDPLVAVFLDQLMQRVHRIAPRRRPRISRLAHRVNWIIPNLRQIPVLPHLGQRIAMTLHRGIRLMLGIDDVTALAHYPDATRQAILHHSTWLYRGADDHDTEEAVVHQSRQIEPWERFPPPSLLIHDPFIPLPPRRFPFEYEDGPEIRLTLEDIVPWPDNQGLLLQPGTPPVRIAIPPGESENRPWVQCSNRSKSPTTLAND